MLTPKVGKIFGAATLGCALLLAGCSGEAGSPDTVRPTGSGDPDAEDPQAALTADDVVAEQEIALAGKAATAEVHPLVRAGEHVVATIDFTGLDEDDYVSWYLFTNDFGSDARLMGLRLIDLAHDEIYFPAIDSEGRNIAPADFSNRGDQRLQVIYDAPEGDSIGLFLPGAPFIPEVPIIDGDVPAGTIDGAGASVDLASVEEAQRFPLESYTRELHGAVETLTSTEEVVVTLGSDVLFDVDSDELSQEATGAVAKAANHLAGREPGTISVVGHTDDVLGTDYNQKLSERRANAVAEELKQHIDTATYPIETAGKGKTDPIVKNDSDENRAKNRRVTLTLVSEINTSTELDRSGDLPEFEDGPTGTGAEGIEIGDESTVRHYRYTATAREVDEHLIVDLEIAALDDQVDSATGIGTLAGHWSYRGDDALGVGRTASGIQVMDGATRVFPLDHYYGETKDGKEVWLPATDLYTLGRIDGGQSRVYSMIYPRVGANWDSITIRALGGVGVEPFELTEIPIDRSGN